MADFGLKSRVRIFVRFWVDGTAVCLIYYVSFSVVGYSSGQRGQTVNLLANAFSGSNPLPTTSFKPTRVVGFVIYGEGAIFFGDK